MKTAEELHRPRPFSEWLEDHGDVLWWRYPVNEAPFVGHPLDSAWEYDCSGDESDLWWTPLPDGATVHNRIGE